MRRVVWCVLFVWVFLSAGLPAVAQQSVWVQIEAQPTRTQALARAAEYARRLDRVSGYALRSGWHAIVLGPFSATEATQVLTQLRVTRQIPGDSYIVDGRQFRERFWPDGPEAPQIAVAPLPEPQEPAVLVPGEQSVAEARAAESLLTREEREEVQAALKWEGHYGSAIDGAFGRGTRASMAAWQRQNGYQDTGVLTTAQREELLAGYRDALASIGMAPVTDMTTGIEIELPLGLVALDRYEPPFAHYAPRGDSGVRVLLISQAGDGATLRSLYEVMQTLEIVPLEGERRLRGSEFTLNGANDRITSYTYARLGNGHIKGFTLIWPAGTDRRRDLVLQTMRASFRPLPDAVLPDSYGATGSQTVDLLAGLQIRQPDFVRSGLFVSPNGDILTTADLAGACRRITVGEDAEAAVVASDEGAGLALLRPTSPLSPAAAGALAVSTPRLRADIAVAGYSFGNVLTAPTLTFGTLQDVRDLQGKPGRLRIEIEALDGDIGGPVLDGQGAVIGVLLPVDKGGRRVLPAGVRFAADAATIGAFLGAAGDAPQMAEPAAALAPEDIALKAEEITAQLSCWN